MATSHIIHDAERGSGATPWAAELVEHSLLPSGAPHLKELLEARHQQQPGRSARLCPSPSGSSIVQTAGDVRLQLRRQLLEELHLCTIADAALYSFLVYSRLYSKKRAVERYTAPSHPTTPLQSYTAYTALYTIQLYTAIQLIQYTALYTHPLKDTWNLRYQ